MDLSPVFDTIRALRDPETGCPWDCEQTLESYAPYVTEEAAELAEAIGGTDLDAVAEEAGDLLWNLCFVIQAAAERGGPDGPEVVRRAVAKMRRRHPHVFGNVPARTREEAYEAFMNAKAAEKSAGRQ
jgi:nucleoside triphosphate diphosphatase